MTMLQAENTKLYAERISQEFAAKLKQDTATAVAETAAVYEKWAGRVEATTRDIEHRISAIAGELGALVERLGSVTDAFEQTAQGAGETRRDIETLGSSISEANDNFTRKVVASVAAIEALAVRLKEHQEIEQSDHEKTMAVKAQTRIDIETIGQTFRTATDAFGRRSDQIAGDCERFSRSALEQLRAGEEHSARMDRAFVEWEGRIEKTAASLVLLLERINSVTESFGRGAAATEQTQLAEDAGNRLKLNTRVLAMVVRRRDPPPGRAEDDDGPPYIAEARKIGFDQVTYDVRLTNAELVRQMRRIHDLGKTGKVRTYPCIFWVRVWDMTSENAKIRWKQAHDNVLESLFGTYNVKDDPWPGSSPL